MLVFSALSHFAQETAVVDNSEPEYKDYKDKDQFEKFQKRRKVVGAWQINELKKGALVVRLRTNRHLIEGLLARGQKQLAEQKAEETYMINRNLMRAYKNNIRFCKVYFITSGSSDSLLKGMRSGIFLDTLLNVDPKIVMNEEFYMLAERDYIYNSSIGFVPEDSAKSVIEHGNPTVEMGIVIKNKYGHQVKPPFPRCVHDMVFNNALVPMTALTLAPSTIWNHIYEGRESRLKPDVSKLPKKTYLVNLKKQFSYEKLSVMIISLDIALESYYRDAPRLRPEEINGNIKPFLY